MRGSSAGIRRKVSASRLGRALHQAVNAAPAGCASGLHLGTQFITLHQPFGSRLQHHWLAGDELGPRSQVIAAWLRTLHQEMARISQVKLVLAALRACMHAVYWIRGDRMVNFVCARLEGQVERAEVAKKLHGSGKPGNDGSIKVAMLNPAGLDRKPAVSHNTTKQWYWGNFTAGGEAPLVGCDDSESLYVYIDGITRLPDGKSLVTHMVLCTDDGGDLPPAADGRTMC